MNPSFVKLPILFSIDQLQRDLIICENDLWTPHFNTQRYEGNWTCVSLRSSSGLSNDILSIANKDYKNTSLLDRCAYFQEVINWFQCEKEAVRLLRLESQSEIKEHSDNDTSYEDGFFRIHIPVITNPEVLFYVNKELVPMNMGECWYANFQLPHSVENRSFESRVHLTIDCVRNAWSDELFARLGFDLNHSSTDIQYSDEVKQQIIAELSRNQSETAAEIIIRLQAK